MFENFWQIFCIGPLSFGRFFYSLFLNTKPVVVCIKSYHNHETFSFLCVQGNEYVCMYLLDAALHRLEDLTYIRWSSLSFPLLQNFHLYDISMEIGHGLCFPMTVLRAIGFRFHSLCLAKIRALVNNTHAYIHHKHINKSSW